MATLLKEGIIVTMCGDEAVKPRVGWVGVVDNRIAMVSYESGDAEAFIAKYPDAEQIECRGRVVMPGLINTHSHVSMTLMRNYADNRSVDQWLNEYIWPFEAHQTDEDIVEGAKLGMAEMLLGGTTTMVDMYMPSYNIAEAARVMGIRAQVGECIISEEGIEHSMANHHRAAEIAAECSRITVSIDPHAPYTCTPTMLDRTKAESVKYTRPMCVHLCEGIDERELIYNRYGLYPAQYLDRHGILTERTILAHSIHLSDEDIDLIAERGCSVSHSPQSNMKLASGVARVVDLLARGVNVTLSTDGASSNNDLDMWEEMRTALLLQRVTRLDSQALMPYEVLRMATVNGARAVGMEGELGVVAEGAIADLIVVDLTAAHLTPNGNIYSALLFCAKSSDVSDVLVDGVVVVRDRTLTQLDCELRELSKSVVQRKKRILKALGVM